MLRASELAAQRCAACEGGTEPLLAQDIAPLLNALAGWQVADKRALVKVFAFKDYYQTIAFVNAVAWIAHREDHHPDLVVTYNQCIIEYRTHSINGLSVNDFICAAKIDQFLGAPA